MGLGCNPAGSGRSNVDSRAGEPPAVRHAARETGGDYAAAASSNAGASPVVSTRWNAAYA